MVIGIEDCYAMSEDADWFAFPANLTRGQVIGAIAYDSSWWDVLHDYTLRKGYVREWDDSPPGGWWEQCEASHDGATPAWIVRRKP